MILLRAYLNADGSALWIIRLLRDLHFPAGYSQVCCAADIEVHQALIFFHRVDIPVDGSEKPCQVGRTACAAEPLRADRFYMALAGVQHRCGRVHLQRVHVEEMLPVECSAGEHRIVQSTLHHVSILTDAFISQHLRRKENESH